MMNLRHLLIALMVIALAEVAFAKEVFIEWGQIPGAERYEVVIERDGKVFQQKIINETKWKGDVPAGMYSYKLRSVDKFRRGGPWSEMRALVVLPNGSLKVSPSDGTKVKVFSPRASIPLQWNALDGVNKYRVTVKYDGRVFQNVVVDKPAFNIPAPPPGEYTWSISALVVADGRAPASVAGKTFESESKATGGFSVEMSNLVKPKQLFPIGGTFPPEDGRLKFQWETVDGAEAYEVSIYKNTGRIIASEKPAAVLYTRDTALEVKMPKVGRYRWEVRGLANIDANKVAGATGPKSESAFEFDKNAVFRAKSGYVAVSTMLAPYSYKIVSPATGLQGTFNSSLVTYRLSGEYWPWLQVGIASGVESSTIQVKGRSYSFNNGELHVKYRMNWSNSKYGWYFNPKAGLEYRQYPELRPNAQTFEISPIYVGALGLSVGADIRRQFTDRFSLGVKASYFLPFMLNGADSTTPTSEASYRNVSVGAQMVYWLSMHWGLAAGGYWDRRSISYKSSVPSVTKSQEVYLDGIYFFGSLLYSF